MKNTKLNFTLLAFSSIISIDTGWAMMLETGKPISRIAVKKRVSPQMIKKRSMHTQGYKPEKPTLLEFQFDNITKEKVRFTDKSHERYRTEIIQPFLKERVAITDQKDDHTLVVNIKKKETK